MSTPHRRLRDRMSGMRRSANVEDRRRDLPFDSAGFASNMLSPDRKPDINHPVPIWDDEPSLSREHVAFDNLRAQASEMRRNPPREEKYAERYTPRRKRQPRIK